MSAASGLDGLCGGRIDQSEWRDLIANFYITACLTRRPKPGRGNLDICVPLEWTIHRPTVTQAALFLAYVACPAEGNATPSRAMSELLLHLNCEGCNRWTPGWIFQWYATTDSSGMVRVYNKPVGLVQASAPLRDALLGIYHYDYDMICSFHSLVASLLSREEAPILHWLVDQLRDQGGKGKDVVCGDMKCWSPKRCVLSVYNDPEPQRHDSATMLWATSRGHMRTPRWFVDFPLEIPACRSRLKEICNQRGYFSTEFQTAASNEMFYYASNVESRLMRGTLRGLRDVRGVLSHYLVHDGVYIENTIDEGVVQEAFNREAATLQLDRVRIARKPWDDAKTEHHRFFSSHGYSYESYIHPSE